MTELDEAYAAYWRAQTRQEERAAYLWIMSLGGNDGGYAGRLYRMINHQGVDPEAIAYTTERAAEITGRSRTRIKKAIRQGEMVALKDGRATIITRAELLRWVDALPRLEPEAQVLDAG
jgi:excisionase family DNA binding protein